MKITKENLSKILSLWTHVEALTPFDIDKDLLRTAQPTSPDGPGMSLFTWSHEDKQQKERLLVELSKLPQSKFERNRYIRVFTVCLGIVSRNEFVNRAEELLRSRLLDISQDLSDFSSEEQKTDDLICLGCLRANHFGKIIRSSIMPSYALAELYKLTNLKKGEKISSDLDNILFELSLFADRFLNLKEEKAYEKKSDKDKSFFGTGVHRLLKKDQKPGEEASKELCDLFDDSEVMNLDKLEALCEEWLKFAGLGPNYQIWVAINHYENPRGLPLDFMNSPYITFLQAMGRRLRTEEPDKFLSPACQRFFRLAYDNTVRKDVLASPENFLELASPVKMPLGRWPGPEGQYLVPTQQIAVASMNDCDPYNPIVTVNGPPGTGKTTILKELVTEIIIKRAYAFSRIKDIETESIFTYKAGYMGAIIPVLNAEYSADFSIVVASNNNNAVENITKELPYEFGFSERADYFSELANALNRTDDAWGFLSAPLGKIDNWSAFWKTLFRRSKKLPGSPYFIAHVIDREIAREGGPAAVRKAWAEECLKFRTLLDEVGGSLKEKCRLYVEDKKKFGVKEVKQEEKEKSIRNLFLSEDKESEINPFDFLGPNKNENHSNRLYTDPDLDRKRTRLFLSALRLQKLVILAKKHEVIDGILGAIEVNVHDIAIPYRAEVLGTICLLVPVISTTFAASAFRFNNFPSNSIPWVIVDEASQATPQSALLLMQKAKRFIVVGDPMQLQPVLTIPNAVSELLCGNDEFLRLWSPHLRSLQQLADGTQDYGAWVGPPERRIWSGLPLRLQRRSHPPMFNICNDIAYSGQMVLPDNMRIASTPAAFIRSFWLDIQPKRASEANFVKEEADALDSVFQYLERELAMKSLCGEIEDQKTVLVCSPFRTVAYHLRKEFGRAEGQWFKVNRIGTVHTLQGRQSDIVIFVLGSKTGKKGFGARSWATGTPNLFNVAVSRAKETLIVIGNFQDWQSHNYVETVSRYLGSYGRGVITPAELDDVNASS